MPPKMTHKPLEFYMKNGDGNYIRMTDIRSVDLTEDPDMDNAERLFRSMAPITVVLRIGSCSNHRRMHGKRAFRMRCYHRWKRYEIYRRYLDR